MHDLILIDMHTQPYLSYIRGEEETTTRVFHDTLHTFRLP